MSGQERANKAKNDQTEEDTTEVPQGADVKEGLEEDVDDMLDEIDEVLEENAAEFVAGYVQKGGQ